MISNKDQSYWKTGAFKDGVGGKGCGNRNQLYVFQVFRIEAVNYVFDAWDGGRDR